MPRRKQDIRRRTGCFQCKEKHLRCTEELPRCRRCETHDLKCVRGLKLIFREDAVQRGLSFGREGVWSKRPRSKTSSKDSAFHGLALHEYVDRWIFLNLTVDDLGQSCRDYQSLPPSDHLPPLPHNSDHDHDHNDFTLKPPPYHSHPLHTFPPTDAHLLDYFIHGISPSCSLSETQNPYISLIVPLSFISETLRNALLAVAANQICLLGRPRFRQEACVYKDKALQGLQRDLGSSSNGSDEGTVATVLMLCFQDISDGCSPSWITHLRGGLKMMDFKNAHRFPSLWKFFRMYFVAHDIMSRTAFDDGECGNLDEELEFWSDGDDLEEIDVLMGCSRGLMTLIHRISALASKRDNITKHRALTPSETDFYTNATTTLYHDLLTLGQTLPPYSQTPSPLLGRIAHIKHQSALLYLTQRLTPSLPQAPSTSPTSPTSIPIPPSTTHLTTSLINSISTLPTPTKATLLWPLFVLGNSCLENQDHRRFVLDRLEDIQQARNLGSVRRTIEAVKHGFGMGGLEPEGERDAGTRLRYISLA